ncbi:MAG: FAD-NAD(P)-binding domain protein [Pseudomonas putida]|nr:MAG: FAD-NAD(P)-binding domain protein [Pseudomonas putida]
MDIRIFTGPVALRAAIVGMGSRGLSLLEQFIALAQANPDKVMQLSLHDPQTPGAGLHAQTQPDYLMLNTMAGQLSAFCGAHPLAPTAGPTFLQWCHEQDIRLDGRGHLSPDATGRPVAFGDFVPRRLLGLYLQASYRWLLQRCPDNLQVRHFAERVSRATPLSDGAGWTLHSSSGEARSCDALFITCGHAQAPSLPTEAGGRVAVEGLGLTAMDTLAALTEGRGGRFVAADNLAGWRYEASGREPSLYLFSRSGLPYHARPAAGVDSHQPWPRLFFTAAAVERLRGQSCQLDFVAQVLPLIEDEMRAVFYQATVRCQAPEQLAELQRDLQAADNDQRRSALFARLALDWGEFDPAGWHAVGHWQGRADGYVSWYRHWIEQDLIRSRLGRAQSPLTQAMEVWRDYRDLLRQVVDHGGLQAHSTLAFYRFFAGVSNRLVGGPQSERYEDLLALLDAGVLQVLPPQRVRRRNGILSLHGLHDDQAPALTVDHLIEARALPSGLSASHHPLLADLLEQGLIRAAHPEPADGVDVDPMGRARYPDGTVHDRLWLLGPAVEGSTFYNHYVPTPDPHCLAPLQARRAVQDCLTRLMQQSRAQLQTSVNCL